MRTIKLNLFFLLAFHLACLFPAEAQEHQIISGKRSKNAMCISEKGMMAAIVVDTDDYEVVKIAASDLANDLKAVTGIQPKTVHSPGKSPQIIIGTAGRSRMLDAFIKSNRIDISKLQNQWEKFIIQAVDAKTLLVIGSDKRATAYGVYELSKQIGVSPWYFWGDVPVKKSSELFAKSGSYAFGPPSVKYRGIFINDEERGLDPWARSTFDPQTKQLGPKTYARIYELMLRLKANVMWPGMKRRGSFYQVEGNKEMADRYAVIIGTSHHEPLLVNSSLEWDEKKDGKWQYDKNAEALKNIMEKRVAEASKYENLYTIGLRGHADLGMEADGGIDERISLMHQIFADQRSILQKHLSRPVDSIPQVFTAYKEVLELVNNGLNIPEDAILVWPDDNYGYIHQLNSNIQQKRKGGSGVYYHLNYVGRPFSTMWISAPSPELIRKELNKAYGNGATKFWMFNVGDIKPYEFLTSYCLDMAWKFNTNDTGLGERFMSRWVKENFGGGHSTEIADLFQQYYQIAFERKPEFMGWNRSEPNTPMTDTEFSIHNYNELQRRLDDSGRLAKRAKKIYSEISPELRSSFFEMIYYPVIATDLVNRKMLYAQINQAHASQGRVAANRYAELSKKANDSLVLLTAEFGEIENGRWKEMMKLQWGAPSSDAAVVSVQPIKGSKMDLDFNGRNFVKGTDTALQLPAFSSIYKEDINMTLFNKGSESFTWTAQASQPWIKLSRESGSCSDESTIQVGIDWAKIPASQQSSGNIILTGAGENISVGVNLFNPSPAEDRKECFVEKQGVTSIYAASYNRKNDKDAYKWVTLNNLGLSGRLVAISDDTLPQVPYEWNFEKNAPSLEYDFYTFNQGWMDVQSFTLPTHAINRQRGCMYGISIDSQPPKIMDFSTRNRNEEWKLNVMRNASIQVSKHFIDKPGKHTLKVWLIDTDVCFDKFIIDAGGLKPSYAGPQESRP